MHGFKKQKVDWSKKKASFGKNKQSNHDEYDDFNKPVNAKRDKKYYDNEDDYDDDPGVRIKNYRREDNED